MLKITRLLLFILTIIDTHLNISLASNDFKDVVDDHRQATKVNTVDPIIIDNIRDYKKLLACVQVNYALLGLYLAEMQSIATCMANKNSHPIILKVHRNLYMMRYEAINTLIDRLDHNHVLIFDPNRPTIKYECNDKRVYEIKPLNYGIKSLIRLPEDRNYDSLIITITTLKDHLTKTIESAQLHKKSLKRT